jgi:hypothetical protein
MRPVGAAAVGAALLFGVPASAGASPRATTCDGTLAPGSYTRVVVPANATCASDGPVRINGGLQIGPGATFVLGSEESAGSSGTINGGVRATNAASVQIHSAGIHGGLDIQGGSGPGTEEIPNFNAIEDNRINGGVVVDGYDGFWFGFIRNHVDGSVNLNNNVLADPDGNEYVTNVINGSLNCAGNSPAPQVGDSEGSPNQVTGSKTGQCANL